MINTTDIKLKKVPLPKQTKSYTPIGHGKIISKVRKELKKNNFIIEHEDYKSTKYGQIALCRIHIRSDKDPDMGMMFSWWNSYNKMLRFGCGVGSFIYDNKTSFIGSQGMSWLRKHTGTASQESDTVIEQLIEQANSYFDKIIAEKERMKALPLSVEDYGCIMGALFFEHELLSCQQSQTIISERKNPTYEYKDMDTLWGLYKLIMFGINDINLRNWAKNQQKLHHLIMAEYAIAIEDMDTTQQLADTLVAPLKANVTLPLSTLPESEEPGEYSWNTEDDKGGDDVCEVDHAAESELLVAEVDFEDDGTPVATPEEPAIIEAPKGPKVIIDIIDMEKEAKRFEEADKNDTPEITGVPDGDTMSDTDDVDEALFENNSTQLNEEQIEMIEKEYAYPLESEKQDILDVTEEGSADNIKTTAMIEKRMIDLYGGIRKYNFTETNQQINVTITETYESFYI